LFRVVQQPTTARWEELMSEPKPKGKAFAISKWVVWEAYQRVKANDGAAGVDGKSIDEFERDLKGNLYKLWNRMSIGELFPSAGAGSRNTEKARARRGQSPRRAHRSRPHRSDGRAPVS
jgi:hypothetical protein